MAEICILQLGKENWNKLYQLPSNVRLDHVECLTKPPEKPYDICFLDREPLEKEIEILPREIKAYTLFITDKIYERDTGLTDRTKWLCKCKKAKCIPSEDVQDFLRQEAGYYYPQPYGEKFALQDIEIAHGFSGKIRWNGNYSVTLEGDFGKDFRQAVCWRYNILLPRGQSLDLWIEYRKNKNVNIIIRIVSYVRRGIAQISNQWEFNEEDLENVIQIQGGETDDVLFVSLSARGQGALEVIALHSRYSRGKHGYFLPGGERYVSSEREEAFCYFDPGDLKPPLNVYFSGYKTKEGFEGYYMMKGMESPFLLLSEPRLEGGGFYMGTPEYERLFVDMIKKYMKELGFNSEQVILSGLSMGTFGAMYYACDIRPHAVIVGKPLASIGNVAANEKYLRPGGFPTALDVLCHQCGSLDESAVEKLNKKFWVKFDAADWGNSKFIVSYMLEDDYDTNAYHMLLSHLKSEGVQIFGKGIHGRHNDNTNAIVNWFVTQYKKTLREDFGRKLED